MATYVLIHGASSDSWYWHRVIPLLRAAGHDVITPNLPVGDPACGIPEYTDTAIATIREHTGDAATPTDLIIVAQSLGGFTGALLATRVPTKLLVYVAAMAPKAGETPGEWWEATGYSEAKRHNDELVGIAGREDLDSEITFFHDVPADITAEALRRPVPQTDGPFKSPPMPEHPNVPVRFLLCRDDRMFPAEFQRRLAKERLGITADEMGGGHLPALAHPEELVRQLEMFRVEAGL
ncbi:alpha/beta hydrolase [Catenulispora subtropica]|uniref:Alpha/beta fold hydrolase n=1 Tax=Catenulispora subtropica TaxID=450798 RepID=A0ABP5C635_9ACTN